MLPVYGMQPRHITLDAQAFPKTCRLAGIGNRQSIMKQEELPTETSAIRTQFEEFSKRNTAISAVTALQTSESRNFFKGTKLATYYRRNIQSKGVQA